MYLSVTHMLWDFYNLSQSCDKFIVKVHSEGYSHTQKQETKLEMLNGWQSLRQGKLWGEKP